MMDFISICAFATISGTIILIISKRERELSIIISSIIYIIIMIYVITKVGELISIIKTTFKNIDSESSKTIISAGGLALISTASSSICKSAGYKEIAYAIEVLTAIEIILISFPSILELFNSIIEFIGE